MNCITNSIVNLYKPQGPTSFAMVNQVKRTLNAKKAGHIGTLDPLAEGILPICLNQATRIIQFLTHLPKVYLATLKLGQATDTQDSTGEVLQDADPSKITETDLKELLPRFLGEQTQLPPMYSAKKKNGVPLYKLARNGITVDRKPVPIQVYAIDFLEKDGDQVRFRVHCSAGTYIRTLSHDIGQQLGCGAHMTGLIREKVGPFEIESSLTPEALTRAQKDGTLSGKMIPTENALSFLPEIRVKADRISSIAHGQAILKSSLETLPDRFQPGMNLRVTGVDQRLVAIVEPLTDENGYGAMEPMDIAFKLKRVLI